MPTIEITLDVGPLSKKNLSRFTSRVRSGVFSDGYTPEMAAKVSDALKDLLSIEVCIIWSKRDQDGFHGDSDFGVVFGGTVYEIRAGFDGFARYLFGQSATRVPAKLKLALGAEVACPTTDGLGNYATKRTA